MDNRTFVPKNICNDSNYKGNLFIRDTLQGYQVRCHELFWSEKTFIGKVCQTLSEVQLLKDSREATIEEQVAIFLMTIGHHEKIECYKNGLNSGETFSRHFNNALKLVVIYSITNILPPPFDEIPNQIQNNNKYWSFLKYVNKIYSYVNIECLCFK